MRPRLPNRSRGFPALEPNGTPGRTVPVSTATSDPWTYRSEVGLALCQTTAPQSGCSPRTPRVQAQAPYAEKGEAQAPGAPTFAAQPTAYGRGRLPQVDGQAVSDASVLTASTSPQAPATSGTWPQPFSVEIGSGRFPARWVAYERAAIRAVARDQHYTTAGEPAPQRPRSAIRDPRPRTFRREHASY